jgi:heme-degrading monooxygenase HmoA
VTTNSTTGTGTTDRRRLIKTAALLGAASTLPTSAVTAQVEPPTNAGPPRPSGAANPTATIAEGTGIVTRINTIVVRPQDQVQLVRAFTDHARSAVVGLSGLVSLSVLHSLDGERLITYGQWESVEAARAAEAVGFPARGIAAAADPHFFEVVYTNDRTPEGATTISERNEWATFVNIMHTTPAQQDALVQFVIGNDNGLFSTHPGFRSTNFHRSLDGERVVNYSHWDDERSFLEAINALFRLPELTMERANELAADAAGDRGWTDFRFYSVDAVVVP